MLEAELGGIIVWSLSCKQTTKGDKIARSW